LRDAKDCLALNASLENGISGWMNNITEEEKRLTYLFLEDPSSFSGLFWERAKG